MMNISVYVSGYTEDIRKICFVQNLIHIQFRADIQYNITGPSNFIYHSDSQVF